MTARETNSTEIKPLTKKTETGGVYRRRPDAELQIEKILTLEKPQILGMLGGNKRRDEAGYLLDETIVYLLRERRDDDFFVETLYAELNRRIWKLLRAFYRKFNHPEDFEDFGQMIEMALIKNIFNLETDAGEYAQVNFGDYVVQTATFAWYARLKKTEREKQIFEIERADGDDAVETKSDENRFVSTEMSQEEKMILRARLAALPENIRNAAILHYLDGWQIESKDAKEPTVSKLFNVSSRTIRNWLTEARAILAA